MYEISNFSNSQRRIFNFFFSMHFCTQRNKNDMSGHSIVHINYKQNRFPLFEQTVCYMWFDLFGMFGGLCGLTFGGSIISVIELIYYGTGRFGAQFTRKIRSERRIARIIDCNNNQSVPSSKALPPPTRPPAVSIYFNELIHYKDKCMEKRLPVWRSQQKRSNAALIEMP